MTRRELTDPFGSDEEEEPVQKEFNNDNKAIPEKNGSLVNGVSDLSPKEKKEDIFSDLPKPNIVSISLKMIRQNCSYI